MKAIFVTGSSGFVGSQLVPVLRARGIKVVGVDRKPPPRGASPDFFVQADLTDIEAWSPALVGVDEVIHLAAAKGDWGLSEDEYNRDNWHATRCLMQQGIRAGVRRWLVFSTVGVYGPSARPLDESGACTPDTPYGRSKLAAESEVARAFAENPDLDIVVLRPSAIFGPGNPPEANVYRLLRAIRRRRFVMVGSGRTLKSTSYIGNVVAATTFLLAREQARRFEAYNYVDEPVLETQELARKIASHLGRRAGWPRVPLAVAVAGARVFDLLGSLARIDFPVTSARILKFCRDTTYSSGRIRDIGFRPPYDLDAAIAETVKWDTQRAS